MSALWTENTKLNPSKIKEDSSCSSHPIVGKMAAQSNFCAQAAQYYQKQTSRIRKATKSFGANALL